VRRDGEIALLVDLSNVCREGESLRRKHQLPAAEWRRFLTLLELWFQAHGPTRVVAVADRSLRPLFEGDRRAYDTAKSWGAEADSQPQFISEADDADVPLLRLAEQGTAPILSWDKFGAYRDEFPWLQGCKDRVLKWEKNGAGELEFVPNELGELKRYDISKAKAAHEEQMLGLTSHDRHFHYRCVNRECEQNQRSPDQLLILPMRIGRRDERLVCRDCEEPVEKAGNRGKAYYFKIGTDHGHLAWFAVEKGAPFIVGRKTPKDLNAWLGSRADKISRRHLTIEVNDQGEPHVRDRGSTNGTTIVGVTGKEKRLKARGQVLGVGQRLVLADQPLWIERSGNYAVVPALPEPVPAGGVATPR
jgi:pSer/pThr/pTyr-binding forkhead associated (FHA) protein